MPGIHGSPLVLYSYLLSFFTVITFLISSLIQVHINFNDFESSSQTCHPSSLPPLSPVRQYIKDRFSDAIFALSINLSTQNHRHDGKDNRNIKMDYQQAELSLIQK